jgi:hypothetical protein
MSTPSLLNIPYRVKGGVSSGLLYSQIPETGAGDFTVTRATTPTADLSTRINSQGFIEVVPNHVARLDYPLGGAVNGCPALLVEPSAVNSALQSAAWNVSPWAATSGSQGATVSGNVTTSPDGTTNADKLVEAAVPGIHICQQTITLTNGTTYTASFFVKASERTLGRFRMTGTTAYWDIEFNLTLGTATGGTNTFIQNYGNGWYRIGATFTANTASNVFNVFLRDASGNVSYTGDGTSGFFVYGAQVEVGSVATSYIPTTTAAITRGAEVIRKTGITSLIGQSEGTVYFEVEVVDDARDRWICTLDSSTSDYIQVWIDSSRRIRVQIVNAGSTVMTTLTSSALSVGYHKMAFAYNTATNGCEMFIDGVQNPAGSATVTGAGIPALNNFTLGSFVSSTTDGLKAHIRADALYPNRLPNTAAAGVLSLATLTTP